MLTRQRISSVVADFVDVNLRGVGQVMLQNNRWTGLLFLLGIFINDWVSGLYAILGTVVGTVSAMSLGAPDDRVRQGLYGFNGTLTGVALAYSLQHNAALVIYVIVAVVFVTVVSAAIKDIFGIKGYPLTAPFVLATWIFVSPLLTANRMHGTSAIGVHETLQNAVPALSTVSLPDVGAGILNGVAQVFLQQNVWTGAIFLVAIAINSRISCVVAFLGSALGLGVALFMGATPIAIQEGLYGFNGVLTAIAVGGIFLVMSRTTALLTILAVCVSSILYGSLAGVFELDLPVLTAPFVLTTWFCLLARNTLARLQELIPANPSTPEGNLLEARQAASESSMEASDGSVVTDARATRDGDTRHLLND